jgi:hypothetical protein
MVAAGMDGVRRGLEPPEERPENVCQLTPAQLKKLHVRPLPETLGETDDQTLTHAFVVAHKATAMNFVFPPASVAEHEIWHLLGCKQHYDWDRCYAQIAALKMQEENFKEIGYFKRIGEEPFYPTWDNLSEHLLISRAQGVITESCGSGAGVKEAA